MADLELRGIVKKFGTVEVLKDVSLKLDDGEFTILLGPSGCGKSTLLRIVAGLERQTQGEVSIGGNTVNHLSARDRDIAMVFQNYALYPHLTVRENLAFGLKMRKEPRQTIEERIQEVAQLLDIGELLDRKPRELSGGQKQRVAMGRAIVRKPKLFLFDEPLSNLDARLRVLMRVELKKLHQRLKATLLYVTHDQVEAMTLGQKIVVMDQGRIRQVGTPEDIYTTPADTFVAGFIGSPAMNLLEGILEKDGAEKGEAHWTFRSKAMTFDLPPTRHLSITPPIESATLGVRPEDLLLEEPKGATIKLEGTIEVVEDLGADRLVHLLAGDWHMVVRISRSGHYAAGQPVGLYLPVDRLHLFIQGRRVGGFTG